MMMMIIGAEEHFWSNLCGADIWGSIQARYKASNYFFIIAQHMGFKLCCGLRVFDRIVPEIVNMLMPFIME